jgi:tRNA nucleotidyltransferase (CCA-adding enzyme)
MDEAARIMLRFGDDGLVVTADDGTLAGVVSKRDVDKATHHKLGHAPVRGFMSAPVIFAKTTASLSEVQRMMVRNDIGRVPILNEKNELIGIVSRKDVLRALFGAEAASDTFRIDARHRRFDFRERLMQLDAPTKWLFEVIGEVAARIGMHAYAVGGCVRDLYMNRPNFDLDFVVEGNAPQLAHALQKAYPGRFDVVAKHERFQTATLVFHADVKREVDLSTARTEFYEFPAALPTVEPSLLEHDLYRRDFTINALAVSLNEGEFGYVIDFFDGVHDIQDKLIRILHSFSFIEDPTRIIRAARFASRLGFKLETKTRQQAERTIEMGIFENLGGFRLKEELKIILESPHRLKALELLRELGGGLKYLASELSFDDSLPSLFRRAHHILTRNRLDRFWIVYLALLLAPLRDNMASVDAVMERLSLSNDEREWIHDGFRLFGELSGTNGWIPRSEIYNTLHGHADQSLAIAASLGAPGTRARRWIKLYLDELRSVRPALSGNDLMRIGFPQGPVIKEALQKLHVARLDGEVQTPAQEFDFVKKLYPQFAG